MTAGPLAELVKAPPRARFAALEVPTFRWYWATSAISITGDGMENILRNWLVWELTGSPLWLGMMVFAHWIPSARWPSPPELRWPSPAARASFWRCWQ